MIWTIVLKDNELSAGLKNGEENRVGKNMFKGSQICKRFRRPRHKNQLSQENIGKSRARQ